MIASSDAPGGDATAQVLGNALELHRSGRRLEAARLYREALDLDPGHPDGLHLSGILASQAGGQVEALEFVDRALARLPGFAEAHNSRGNILRALGRPDDALGAYRQAISLAPADPVGWNNLGNALRELGRPEEALRAYREALARRADLAETRLNLGLVLAELGYDVEALAAFEHSVRSRPDLAPAHAHLGRALRHAGQLEEAVESYRRAVALEPQFTIAYCELGATLAESGRYSEAADALQAALALDPDCPEAHNWMGTVCKALGYRDQALSAYRQALADRPDYPEAHYNLGVLLGELHRPVEAVASFRAALTFRADYAEAHASMGAALLRLSRSAEAVVAFRRAIELNPASATVWFNLGRALQEELQTSEAIVAFGRALTIRRGYPEAHWYRGLALLAAGDYAAGWEDYEWRWKVPELRPEERRFEVPCWDGSPLAGRTILVHAERDPGETLQFARFLPLLAGQGGRVVLEAPPSLARLLEGMPSLAQVIVAGDRLPPVDLQIPLLSLPRLLGIRPHTLPNELPYLPGQVWSGRIPVLPPAEGLRVGIIWNGGTGPDRSIPLGQLAPLLQLPGVAWYSLQGEELAAELAQAPEGTVVCDLSPQVRDLTDTAALATQLDLIISTDGTVAHLAGGLGLPLWVVLPAAQDWRWTTEGETCLWYPTARVFRQSRQGDWSDVVEAMRQALLAVTIVEADSGRS